jgi:dihydroorotase
MEYARGFDLPIIDHCEDKSLARGGVMHEGHWSLVLGLQESPPRPKKSMPSAIAHWRS